ncbi:unnamed protein product, partial [Brassica oleracea]
CLQHIAIVAVPKAITRRREAMYMHTYTNLTNLLSILLEDGVMTISTNKATKEKKASTRSSSGRFFFFFLRIPHLRLIEYKRSRFSRNRRTVNRAYGSALSGVADWIVRAFLVEEQKIVKK